MIDDSRWIEKHADGIVNGDALNQAQSEFLSESAEHQLHGDDGKR